MRGASTIINQLRAWKEGDQAKVGIGQLEAGVFGIVDESDADNNITPDGTIGLIFSDYKKINNYQLDRVEVTLTFRRSRGIDI